VLGVGGAAKAPVRTGAQPRRPHQPCYSLARDTPTALAQFRMDPWTAVAAAALGVDRAHLQSQALILTRALCHRPLLPGVVACTRDLQHPADQRHRIAGLLRRDEPKPHWCSLAKKAVAFLRNLTFCYRTSLRENESELSCSPVQATDDATAITLLIVICSRV
jgi:hypothetical protein